MSTCADEDGSPLELNRTPESAWKCGWPSPVDSNPASAALLFNWLGDECVGRALPPTSCIVDDWDWAALELPL